MERMWKEGRCVSNFFQKALGVAWKQTPVISSNQVIKAQIVFGTALVNAEYACFPQRQTWYQKFIQRSKSNGPRWFLEGLYAAVNVNDRLIK